MAVECTGFSITSSCSEVSAVSVGDGLWVFRDRLRGRTLTAEQALTLVQFADAICSRELAPLNDPIWQEWEASLRPVGLSVREVIFLLALPFKLPPPTTLFAGECPVKKGRLARWLQR
ncbi:hypothetical protein [Nocardia blacklockiae]|uniref:hypothetical protein n=1 Tax=Nocardia blacklockiae TaxID=480036 RepID=UPI001895562B|nr:hypothetical protein [Nocardia blacklockiae]MBF6171086.1 hypothetical protein [Nocardia blacklockiae]